MTNKHKWVSCPRNDVVLQSSVANKGSFVVYTRDNKRSSTQHISG